MIADSILNGMIDYAKTEESGIVLVNSSGTTVASMSDTTDSVSWDTTTVGKITLDADIEYDITAGDEVAGWRAIDSSTNKIFGEDFASAESYTNDGIFILESTDTYFTVAES